MPHSSTTSASTSTARRTSRGSASARQMVFDMLKDDHKRLKTAIRRFEKLDIEDDAEECEAIVRQACTELEVHAELEEQIFYPAAREAMKEADLIDEAEVEHMSAKMLIEQLKGMGPQDEKFKATFTVLGEYVKHHVKEEESEMFVQLEKARLDWSALCEEMQQRRSELMQEHGLSDAATDGESA